MTGGMEMVKEVGRPRFHGGVAMKASVDVLPVVDEPRRNDRRDGDGQGGGSARFHGGVAVKTSVDEPRSSSLEEANDDGWRSMDEANDDEWPRPEE